MQRLIDSAVAGERAEEAVIDQAEYINDTVNELYSGNETIRASNAEVFFLERADGVIRRWFGLEKKRAKENVLYDILRITGLMNAAHILIYCQGGLFVTRGTLTIGVVNTFALYFSSLWNSVEGFWDFAKKCQNDLPGPAWRVSREGGRAAGQGGAARV